MGAQEGPHQYNGEPGTLKIDDAGSPLTKHFGGKGFSMIDEFYHFPPTGPYTREKLHVLVSVDAEKTDLRRWPIRPDNDYGMVWIKTFGKGRVFNSVLGHRPDFYMMPDLVKLMVGGIQFVLGRSGRRHDSEREVALEDNAEMLGTMRKRLAATALLAFVLFTNGSASQQVPTAGQLLDRATASVEDFVAKFSRVVAEEQYLQEYLSAAPGEGSNSSFPGAPQVRERRRLKSDLLLVKLPQTGEWHVFRDVFEVDGRPVRDREDTLATLFLRSADAAKAIDRAKEVAAASARFNIRPIGTLDHPFLALAFLQRDYHYRFRFALGGREEAVAPDAYVLEFHETARPTIVRGTGDKDVFARGRYWIAGSSGRILKTEIILNALGNESAITARFEFDDRLGTQVPVEMRFRRAVAKSEVRGVATYSGFRQFEVGTEETIQK